MRRLVSERRFSPAEALEEVAGATADALADGRALDKNELHASLRERVRGDLIPWCAGCKSHHVAPMLWRYGGVKAGVRLDSRRRYLLAAMPPQTPTGGEVVRRFLRFYGPATTADLASWAGVATPHARRLWAEVAGELTEVAVGKGSEAWLLSDDLDDLQSPPMAEGIRLIPPGDPYLQKPNRALLVPEATLRKRLFRPVGSPGVILRDGRLAGLWRVRSHRDNAEITVEKLGRLAGTDLQDEAHTVALLRGASEAVLTLG